MLNKERAGDIFDRIRKYSTADEVEVLFYGGKSALTRFAITPSIRTSRKKTMGCLCAQPLMGGQRVPLQINLMRRALGVSCRHRKRWLECSSLIQICCQCRTRARAPAPHS